MGQVVLGMIGLGTVGTGVARLLENQRGLRLKKVAVKDPSKERMVKLSCPLTRDASELIEDPEIEVIVEVMGGEEPALTLIRDAINRHKHIVTANKELLAKHGPELFELARSKDVAIFFEASVAGGIPLISTINKGLGANKFTSVSGILNGTTNFILSSMEKDGVSYESALAQAQVLGFAEADPSNDVEGIDVAYKLSILCALCYGHFAQPSSIYRHGITHIGADDVAYAAKFGCRIKLLGVASRDISFRTGPSKKVPEDADKISVRVQPYLVPLSHPFAAISGSNNAILLSGDAVGEVMLTGPGAGEMPTASAIVGDLINLAQAVSLPEFASYFQPSVDSGWCKTRPTGDWQSSYFLRLLVNDEPGIIGKIGNILGTHKVNIDTISQHHVPGGTMVVLTANKVSASNMDAAVKEFTSSSFVKKVASCMSMLSADE